MEDFQSSKQTIFLSIPHRNSVKCIYRAVGLAVTGGWGCRPARFTYLPTVGVNLYAAHGQLGGGREGGGGGG